MVIEILSSSRYLDDFPNGKQGRAPAKARRDDKIRTPPFFQIRHLSRDNAGELLFRHTRPAKHAQALQEKRR